MSHAEWLRDEAAKCDSKEDWTALTGAADYIEQLEAGLADSVEMLHKAGARIAELETHLNWRNQDGAS